MAKKIYLDYAATTPVDSKVLKAMLPYFSDDFGNAMSIHQFGQGALAATDNARDKVAGFFNASPSEIVFTSGATEANNLAVKGVVKAYYSQFPTNYESGTNIRITNDKKFKKPHIVTTAFEHHCVLYACRSVAKEGLAEVTYVKPGRDGVIKAADIKRAIRSNTILISVMYVNNEIGTVQPIAEIGKLIKAHNQRFSTDSRWKIIFHTDATQAVNYFSCDVEKLGADLLSMSAHKIYGPKGIGALYVRKGTPIRHIQEGGDQEYKLRAGTHNVPGIVGLGAAIELAARSVKRETEKIKNLRDYLIKKVLKEISGAKLNGSKMKRSPNNANFSFENIEGEGLILSLDVEGIAASTGSACSSGALAPSHVLLSIGLKPEKAHGSLRMTLGRHTTRKDIDTAVDRLKATIGRLRKISGRVLEDYYNNSHNA